MMSVGSLFKPRDSILLPDLRNSRLTIVNVLTGIARPMCAEDFHDLLSEVTINETAPPEVRREFDVARNIFLYSWFAYELATIAERQAYGTLEMALRARNEAARARGEPTSTKKKDDLKSLVAAAFRLDWLDRDEFTADAGLAGQRVSLLEVIVELRNSISHGRVHLFPEGSLDMLKLCAEVINKLFPDNSLLPE